MDQRRELELPSVPHQKMNWNEIVSILVCKQFHYNLHSIQLLCLSFTRARTRHICAPCSIDVFDVHFSRVLFFRYIHSNVYVCVCFSSRFSPGSSHPSQWNIGQQKRVQLAVEQRLWLFERINGQMYVRSVCERDVSYLLLIDLWCVMISELMFSVLLCTAHVHCPWNTGRIEIHLMQCIRPAATAIHIKHKHIECESSGKCCASQVNEEWMFSIIKLWWELMTLASGK